MIWHQKKNSSLFYVEKRTISYKGQRLCSAVFSTKKDCFSTHQSAIEKLQQFFLGFLSWWQLTSHGLLPYFRQYIYQTKRLRDFSRNCCANNEYNLHNKYSFISFFLLRRFLDFVIVIFNLIYWSSHFI